MENSMSSPMLKGLGYFNKQSKFEEKLNDGEPIYVLNNTEPRGVLICTINDPSSGKPRKLEFPKTWIPFCLTDMLPRNVISNSLELRQYINNGLLTLKT